MPQAGGPDPGTRRSDDGDSEGDKGNDYTCRVDFHVLPTMTLIIPCIPDSTPLEPLGCYLFWTLGSPKSSEISSLCWITCSL